MFGLPDVLGIKSALIAGAVSLVVGLGAGAYAGYRWEHGAVLSLQLADVKAQAAALGRSFQMQQVIAKANDKNGAHDVVEQTKIVDHYITVTREIPTYVHDSIACPGGTYGFVRVLVAAERGIAAATLPLPAGVTVDTCSPLEPSGLAADLAADLAAARGNAQQLDDLEASVRENEALAAP